MSEKNTIPQNSVSKLKVTKKNKKVGKKNIKKQKKGRLVVHPPQELLNERKTLKEPLIKKPLKNGKSGKVMFWNKGGSKFLVKKDDIEILLGEHQPIAFGIAEANMSIDCHEATLKILDYTLERDNLIEEGLRTRLALYIKSTVQYKRRTDLEPKCTPAIWVEFNAGTSSAWLLFTGYREWRTLDPKKRVESGSQSSQLKRLDSWQDSWVLASSEGKPVFIIGDLNIDVQPWLDQSTDLTDYQVQRKPLLNKLKEMAGINDLSLLATPPTRSQGQDRDSTIDIVLTNKAELINSVELLPSSSDHRVVVVRKEAKVVSIPQEAITARSFKLYSKEKMLNCLDIPMLNSLLQLTDPNLVANVLVSHITSAIDRVAPYKTVQQRRNYAPHLSQHTKELMKLRNELRVKHRFSGLLSDEIAFKRARNTAVRSQRSDRKNWASKMIYDTVNKGLDSKKMWNVAKSISGECKKETVQKLTIRGVITKDKTEIANGLNDHFINKVRKLVGNMPHQQTDILKTLTSTPTPSGPKLQLKELKIEKLDEYVRKMKRNSSAGSDSISGLILFDIYDSVKRVIQHLINLSMCLGIFPNIFKLTKITPIVKAGKNPIDPASYRPVANLCSIAKLLECSVMDQVRQHLDDNSFFNPNQHGSRSGHSTTTCVTEILEDNHEAMENGHLTALTAIDMSAAFDLVDHGILTQQCRLAKLGELGEPTLNWIESFLADRTQMVCINGTYSKITATGRKGVVQGGMSSCLLFTIYLNDLPAQVNGGVKATSTLHSTSKEYIDDLTTISRGRDLAELKANIEKDLSNLSQFLINYKMVINQEKTQLMFVKPKAESESLTVFFNGNKVPHQNTMKILGITLAADLTFDQHIHAGQSNMLKSVRYKATLLKAIKPFLPVKALSTIGSGLVNSTIMYGAPIWGTTSEKNISLVQSAQTRVARMLLGATWGTDRLTHRQTLFNRLNWPNVSQILLAATSSLARKASLNTSSQGLNKVLNKVKTKSLRQQDITRIRHSGPAKRKSNIFSANAALTYNGLPKTLKNPTLTNDQFKRKIKEYSRKVKLLI